MGVENFNGNKDFKRKRDRMLPQSTPTNYDSQRTCGKGKGMLEVTGERSPKTQWTGP